MYILINVLVHNLWHDMIYMLIGCWLGRCSVYLHKILIYDTYRSHGKTSHCNWLIVQVTLLWTQCDSNQSFITTLVYSVYLKPGKKVYYLVQWPHVFFNSIHVTWNTVYCTSWDNSFLLEYKNNTLMWGFALISKCLGALISRKIP